MKKLLIAFVFTFFILPGWSFAENYNDLPDTFFSFIKQGKAGEAIDYVYGTNKWINKNSDQVINLKNQLSQLNKLVGQYLFHELIQEGKVGSRYVHLIYLVGYERQPLRFELRLYKPGEGWRFHGVSFDTKVLDDIEKQSNERLLKR